MADGNITVEVVVKPDDVLALAAEVKRLRAELDEVSNWQAEGDRLFAVGGKGALFSLGVWWADRPWRKRA